MRGAGKQFVDLGNVTGSVPTHNNAVRGENCYVHTVTGKSHRRVAWRLRKIKNTYLITERVYKSDN
jgi:hypothetical protein